MEQNPAIIIKDSIEMLSKDIKFLSGEIAAFKEALCGIVKEINESSNKALHASIWYFVGSIILSGIIAFSALVQILKK